MSEGEKFYRLAVEAGRIGTWDLDLQTDECLISPKMAELMDFSVDRTTVPGARWREAIVPEDWNSMASALAASIESDAPFDLEFRIALKDGTQRWLYSRGAVSRDDSGKALRMYGVSIDVTEGKRAEETLVRVREAERNRIARDLHDGPLQNFSYTAAALGMLMLQSEDTELKEWLQGAIDAVRHGAQGLREVVNDLRIEDGEDRPFAEVVESVVKRSRILSRDAEVSLEVGEGMRRAPLGETGTQVSRVIREALTNARRHSGAKRISVSVRMEGDDLLAEITDGGVGFGPDASPGVGFTSMRERAALVGGYLEIESEEGLGTSVRLRVPMLRRTTE